MAAATTADNVVLNIGDMIDMAIGTPEVGVVDFNMLQTVLHCLAQQQHIRTKPVEVRGLSIPINVGRENQNASTINVTEFAVGTDGKAPMAKVEPQESNDTILVVERVKKTDSPTLQTAKPVQASPPLPSGAPGQAGVSGQEGLTLVTYSKFNLLESTVQDLQKRVYGSIPKNEDILEEVRSQTNIKAIQDMWTNLNVSARLEAAETGIAKLSSLVEDIIKETAGLHDAIASRPATGHAGGPAGGVVAIDGPAGGTDTTPAGSTPIAATPSAAGATPASVGAPLVASASKEDMDGLTEYVNQIRSDLDNLTDVFYRALKQMPVEIDLPPPPEPGSRLEEILAPPTAGGTGGGGGGGGTKSGGTPRSSRPPTKERTGGSGGVDSDVLELMVRLNDVEKRLDSCCKTLGKEEGVVSDQLNSFQDQLEYLSKQVAGLTNVSAGPITPDLIKDLQGLMQLFQTVQEMQEQLKQVHETALQLAAEKEDRKHHINVLLEQIELLKTIKLDREDMAEAMADKADLRMLARKVSHDQFELACDDLSRGLEHALGKLNMQEALWQQALDDIQREIETKLDKMELSPVKEFFNSKLKLLQESLKQMASLRREAEAAGTKRKLLRDVNCLSCDANVVMATEAPPSIPVPKPFPAALSMKPYLSYELDTIRKTQASNLPQRNMHDWENIDKQMTQQPKPQIKVRSGADKHLCNRYCGGSHTTTTPAQRVARLGHFIKEWGPDVLPLSSGFAAGDDGKMYRVQAERGSVGPGGTVDTCTPKVSRKPELPQVSTERLIGEDCKCLEPATPGASKK